MRKFWYIPKKGDFVRDVGSCYSFAGVAYGIVTSHFLENILGLCDVRFIKVSGIRFDGSRYPYKGTWYYSNNELEKVSMKEVVLELL